MSKGYYQLKPCPVCESTSGNCRGKNDDGKEYFLCMTYADSRAGEVINGYKCLKTSDPSYQYPGATFVMPNDEEWKKWTEADRQLWEAKKTARERKAQAQKQREVDNCLTAQQRHKLYSNLLAELPIDENTVNDLLGRGFTQSQIEASGFKTVTTYQPLKSEYPQKLPGINKAGKSLTNRESGYLIPVRDYDGLIVGCQIRIHNPTDKTRYKWLNYWQTLDLLLPDGTLEKPLAVYKPEGKACGVALVEGTGAKPFLAADRLNALVIGASGGQFLSSKQLLATYLNRACEDYKLDKVVTIYPDAGDIKNKKEMIKWQNANNYLLSIGYQVEFAWWDQVDKTCCDIDELEDFNNIQYLSFEEFSKFSEFDLDASNVIELPTNNSGKKSESIGNLNWHKWIKSRQFTPTITINQPEFSFPQIPQNNAIISVKSGMGTGKTKAMIEEIKRSPNRALLLGCLNNLLLQTISRAMAEGVTMYHLHEDNAHNLIKDIETILAFCINSMQHLDGHYNRVDLYIDEICSVIMSMLSAGTLGNRQGYIMKVFERAIRAANRVFILDANNSDLITNFISKIDPTKTVVKIENIAKPRPHHFKFVNGYNPQKDAIKQRDKSPLIKMMCNEDINPWIASDSRDFTDAIAQILNDEGKQGYVLNSGTASNDWAKLFLNNPDEFLATKQPNYFAISPTANSGVSITNKAKFTHKFSIIVGVLPTNEQTQILFRFRPGDIDHYIFCPQFSKKNKVATPGEYKNQIESIIELSANLANDENNNSMNEVLNDVICKGRQTEWYKLSSELGWLDKFERNNSKKCLIYALEEQGHTIEEIDLEISEYHNKKLSEAKDLVMTKRALEIFKAEKFDSIDEANRVARTNPKTEVMRRVEKTRLLDRVPGIDNTKVWDAEFVKTTLVDRDFISKQQRFWMLNNCEISRKRSEVNWFYNATDENFYLGSMVNDAHLRIWALQKLNILQFTDGREFHKNSLEVIEFYNQATTNSEIFTALNMDIPPPSVKGRERIDLIKKCLNYIGLSIEYTSRKMVDGVRYYHYKIDTDKLADIVRLEILAATERKYSNYLSSERVKSIDWTNHLSQTQKPEEKTNILNNSQIIAGDVELIREILKDGSATWEMVQSLFTVCGEDNKKAIWHQLTLAERNHLKLLQPQTIEGQWCKHLIDASKTKDANTLALALNQFLEFYQTANDGQILVISDYLPSNLLKRLGKLAS